jgi:hypothetical protein
MGLTERTRDVTECTMGVPDRTMDVPGRMRDVTQTGTTGRAIRPPTVAHHLSSHFSRSDEVSVPTVRGAQSLYCAIPATGRPTRSGKVCKTAQ